MIAYLSTIVWMIDKLGNQKMQVVKYLLQEMDSNNLIIKTIAEINSAKERYLLTKFRTID